MSLSNDSNDWSKILLNPEAQAELQALRRRADGLPDADSSDMVPALQKLAWQEGLAFLQGIENYCHHDYPLFEYETPPIAFGAKEKDGDGRLYRLPQPTETKGGEGSVLLVPSLVNRAYIMHLLKDRSFANYLNKSGLDVWILEWFGEPHGQNAGESGERGKNGEGFDDYVGELVAAIHHIQEATGESPSLVGYCMGGLFTLSVCYLYPELVRSQVLLGVPWDFSAYRSPYHRGLIEALASLAESGDGQEGRVGEVSADMMAVYFWLINPLGSYEKFVRFSKMAGDSAAGMRFVALEDWLNDGTQLPSSLVSRLCCEWYRDNVTMGAGFQVCGERLQLQGISTPSYVAVGRGDRIVPALSSAPLVLELADCESVTVNLGHIGMMASERAEKLLWDKVARFLLQNGAG